jgi:hypothetical protein
MNATDPFAFARSEDDPVLILAAEMRAVEARLREIPEEPHQEREQLEERWSEINDGLETTLATTLAGIIEQLLHQQKFFDGELDTIIAGLRTIVEREAQS